jgi:hypothetical protein
MNRRDSILFALSALFGFSPPGAAWADQKDRKLFVFLNFEEHRFILSMDHEDDCSDIRIRASQGMELVVDCFEKGFKLMGTGEIRYKRHLIEFSPASVLFDGKALPTKEGGLILTKEGKLIKGGFAPFDK